MNRPAVPDQMILSGDNQRDCAQNHMMWDTCRRRKVVASLALKVPELFHEPSHETGAIFTQRKEPKKPERREQTTDCCRRQNTAYSGTNPHSHFMSTTSECLCNPLCC